MRKAAPERLCIVQPAISAQMAKLEAALGGRYWSAPSRGIHPTNAAIELYARAVALMCELDEAQSKVAELVKCDAQRAAARQSQRHALRAVQDFEDQRSMETQRINAVLDVMQDRMAVRRFLPRAVPEATVREVLRCASYAPSGANLQPWQVYVLAGESRLALADALEHAFWHCADEHNDEYRYYPPEGLEPFTERKQAFGRLFYGALGVAKDDADSRRRQSARNFRFFDAPVGMIFTIDRQLEQGSWLDYGMFLQNIMLAAKACALDTCPQVSIARFHRLIRERLAIPDSELVVCGMSLGYRDPEAVELGARQPRLEVSRFASFVGF